MEKTSKVNRPASLLGIKSMKEVGEMEKELVDMIENFDNSIEEDPQAHQKLIELGKMISEKNDIDVKEFLEDRSNC